MIYLIFGAVIAALAVLYKFLPTRKIFLVLCTILLVVFTTGAFIHGRSVQREQITRAQTEELQARQKIFGEWYAGYQKDIDRLDRNWQSYHNILDKLNTVDADSFNAQALHLRLKELEQESIDEQLKIHMMAVPQDIGRENRRLVEEIIRKTQRYVDAQTLTISISALATKYITDADLEFIRLKLNDIMIRESPEGLFTAQEISAIRTALGD